MNPEIHEIIKELENRSKKDAINETDKQNYFLAQSSKLSVLLAEEEERRSKEVSKQTKKIINLTRAIYAFTIVMVIVGIVQIAMAIID